MDTPSPIAGAENAKYALGLLRAAGLQPTFGFNIDEAEELWAGQIKQFSLEVIERAVIEWSKEPEGTFPTMEEFRIVCEMSARHLRREAAEALGPVNERRTGEPCTECGGSNTDPNFPNNEDENAPGWVVVEDTGIDQRTVRPCQLCRPEQHALWVAGCFAPNHYGCARCRSGRIRTRAAS
jgi:hypothetical protein